MRENCVRENIASKFVSTQHVDGKINLADIFTKEMKDTAHFVELCNLLCVINYIPEFKCMWIIHFHVFFLPLLFLRGV
jgi:hypothetical protein